ncbi:tryptophan dimethylallyltransferase family protein [Streptomyces sp. NPDC045470]|uniref:tryptophan dimethylallyltransferase family protein n=1 Tax=Streptomyces sp. NPDC045470 TaxID=3155469 RepID=UPI0033C30CA1
MDGLGGRPERLGTFVAGQCWRLCAAAGRDSDASIYQELLLALLGPAAARRLAAPAVPTITSDDGTPVEFALLFQAGSAPVVGLSVEPGGSTGDLAADGRTGRRILADLAARWSFSLDRLRRIEDLFFPAAPCGPAAVGCAAVVRRGQVGFKVYLNPGARGAEQAAPTVEEALGRLGYRAAAGALLRRAAARHPKFDTFPFFSLDLGLWDTPRVKTYVAHREITADAVAAVAGLVLAPQQCEQVADFFRLAAGSEHCDRSPVVSYFSYTDTATDRPSGYTLQVPVRDYVRDDLEAYRRAVAALQRYGMDAGVLDGALAALTPRRLESGRGLVAYLALSFEHAQPPRITAYLASQAYAATPPRPTA